MKNVNMPKRRAFFRHALPISLAIHPVFLRQIGFAWRKNPSLLGIFPFFKQRLVAYIKIRTNVGYLFLFVVTTIEYSRFLFRRKGNFSPVRPMIRRKLGRIWQSTQKGLLRFVVNAP